MLGFVEFQNGTWNWKLWKLPNQSVFLSARALPQVSFEYLQGYIFHSLPGKLIPVLDQIIGKKKNSLMMKWIFLYFNLCLLTLVLSLGTTGRLSLSSLLLPIRNLCTWIKFPWSLFSQSWKIPTVYASPFYGP